ncbi:MAG: GIY-YIG nuclease family protein [Bacteroidetes bacterium]|nr:GIY-YIG nuclease family protein [Bacteroidota bacterium]
MIYLYVIKSNVNGHLYVGICKDLAKRMREHSHGKNRYTKGLRPWKLVLTEKYQDWKTARKKEKYYKSGYGKENLKKSAPIVQRIE